MDTTQVRRVSRRLRDLCEPIAGSVYFVPEAQQAYSDLGLDNYAISYFASRGACLGQPPGEVVTAAFGVFNPSIVIPSVQTAWTRTDAQTLLQARENGAVAGLRRLLGEAETERVVEILRPVMESVTYAGRMLFAGLRSLEFPADPLAQLWRVCDYVRERRGDGHIAAWVAAGCDAVEISLLTELYWNLELGTYIRTRGWNDDQVRSGIDRLSRRGLVSDGAFTDEGRDYRRDIENRTDELERSVVERLGDPDELFGLLEPLQKAVLAGGGYPVDPARTMSADLETLEAKAR